jgi:hypothetical protein
VQDLREVGVVAGMKRGRAEMILAEVREAIARWRELAEQAGVDDDTAARMGTAHRVNLPAG